jgi:hypothetical protein
MIKAESNYWGDLAPADQVAGSVDFSPFLELPPATTTSDNTPPAPSSVWRTDTPSSE